MSIGTIAASLVRPVIDFALPPRCPSCGTVTGVDHSFCLDCWTKLHFLTEPCCACCGTPFDHSHGEGVKCGSCLADPPRFDSARAAVAYGEIARRVALKLKYGRRPGVARTLARAMARHLRMHDQAVLVPVPLHRWRIWRRGYNQSALIASALSKESGMELLVDALQRTRPTPPLRGLGRRQRAAAVQGAFSVPAKRRKDLKQKSVVLIDDVLTSGATANACALALRRAGVIRVDIICWARVVATTEV